MDMYTPESAAPTTILAPLDSNPGGETLTHNNWAGFWAGNGNAVNDTYVAVKADMTVPTADGCVSSGNTLYGWVGLGGTNYPNDTADLLQMGFECDYNPINPSYTTLPNTGGLHPFREFASTNEPQELCGTAQDLTAGDTIYMNMSYQTSNTIGYFFMEDVTTGTVLDSCSVTPPSGWSYDGSTADYVLEVANHGVAKPPGFSISQVNFTDAETELDSNSQWVTFGSQATTKTIDGTPSNGYCEAPSTIGADQQSFSDTESGGYCAADN